MKKSLISRLRANFLTGLAVVLPVIVSLGIMIWLFGTVSNITDLLLFFLPRSVTHEGDGTGPTLWYWSAVAFLLAALLISVVGLLTRLYIGKQAIALVDNLMLRVPLLNKVYGTIKQVNDAFSSGGKSSFQTVVLIEFPRKGVYSIGFITSEQNDEIQMKTQEKVLCIFVPTTPNPTSGYLALVPERDVLKLEMSVAEAIRYIISLGSVPPEYLPGSTATIAPAAAVSPPPPADR